jgi:hypothetical protein
MKRHEVWWWQRRPGWPRRPWRATALGWLLRIHSPSAHIMDDCWCQRRRK